MALGDQNNPLSADLVDLVPRSLLKYLPLPPPPPPPLRGPAATTQSRAAARRPTGPPQASSLYLSPSCRRARLKPAGRRCLQSQLMLFHSMLQVVGGIDAADFRESRPPSPPWPFLNLRRPLSWASGPPPSRAEMNGARTAKKF